MQMGPQLLSFVQDCFEVSDMGALRLLLDRVTRALGFEQYALVNHVDLLGPPASAMVLMSYEEDWIHRALTRRYHLDDPIHAASTRTLTSFLWRDVPHMIALTQRQTRILDEARAFGLCEGLTVPVHAPGDFRGSFSFGARSLHHMSTQVLAAAQVIGTFGFEAARRVHRARLALDGRSPALPSLSQRQLDCIALVANGKGDGEIAYLLGLSEPTVHQHIGTAMRRYGVTKRTQLIVRALFDGQICFREMLRT